MDKLICSKCKKEIPDDMAYVSVRGDIILRMPKRKPIVFTCPEQAENYARQMTSLSVTANSLAVLFTSSLALGFAVQSA
jgi:hypothetical protein